MTWFTTPRQRFVAGVLLVIAALGGVVVFDRFFREEPAPYFQSDEDHFLYGSVGTEAAGVPYWIWLVLPRIFPEYLEPGGYASIGILSRDGHEMPIGLSKATVGVPRVGVNCAMCHSATFRARPDDVPMIYPATAAHQATEQAYVRFLVACANDPRFTPDTILGEIAKNTSLSLATRLQYRLFVIPNARRDILRLQDDRTATPIHPPYGDASQSDSMPLWNLRRRDGTPFFRDGLNASLREAVQWSATSEGTPAKWMDRDYAAWDSTVPTAMSSLRRVMNYIGDLKAPKYPLPIDAQLAAAGANTFDSTCASCHKTGGPRAGSVIPWSEIGTDRTRLDLWTSAAAAAANGAGDAHPWKFSGFKKTDGYLAVPLDGVWLTAPYLHNGSVPTLADLLEPVAARPKQFWRGYDVYDSTRVGFITAGAAAERTGDLFDIARPGHGNAGHTYGTQLAPEQKRALLEYLKTL
ncbi:MAG TPA: hypothetical protein VGG73_07275 [Vicinamibacterales bacterium]